MFKLILIASSLVILALSLSSLNERDSKNCASGAVGYCRKCFNSFIDSDFQCSDIPLDQDQNCSMYGTEAECLMCKPGYGLIVVEKNKPRKDLVQCR